MKRCIAGGVHYLSIHRGKHEASRVRVNKLGDAASGEKFEPFTLLCRLTANAVDTTDGIDQISRVIA